jgi:hypothetical protein
VRLRRAAAGFAIATLVGAAVGPGCSQGSGGGTACGTLAIADCWTGVFNLQPDFFAAVPDESGDGADSLQIRVQNGGDYETFSDGLDILIDDVGAITPGQLGQTLQVSLPAGVALPGVPLIANPQPSLVHAVLYLGKSCRTQNVALYALEAVSLGPTGDCGAPLGEPPNACPLLGESLESATGSGDGSASADATVPDAGAASGGDAGGAPSAGPVAGSTIVFDALFDGNPNESNAERRLTEVPAFDLYFADPREITPGGFGPPPPCRAHLVGNFKFYFERGQPEQPFQ